MDEPEETSMEQDKKFDRRTFLKTAAAGVGGATAGTVMAQVTPPEETREAKNAAKETGKKKTGVPGDITIERPGSDFMMDVIKTLDIDYVATNPGSSFRSLHESLINY